MQVRSPALSPEQITKWPGAVEERIDTIKPLRRLQLLSEAKAVFADSKNIANRLGHFWGISLSVCQRAAAS